MNSDTVSASISPLYHMKEIYKNRFPVFHFRQISPVRSQTFQETGVYMAIPRGKKYYAWFTFYKTYNVCIFMNSSTGDLFYEKVDYSPLSLGTVLYGTLVTRNNFVAENVFFYEGRHVGDISCIKKCALFLEIVRARKSALPHNTCISIAAMWCGATPPEFYCAEKTYQVFDLTAAARAPKSTPPQPSQPPPQPKSQPQQPQPKSQQQQQQQRIFFVKADLMNDIYHLYVKTDNAAPTEKNLKYHSIAFIPDYKTSVFMNKIFRKIRENDNLDYIEESDDEDFEDTSYDKYVYLDKIQRMMCKYNPKFKKWAPII